MNPILQKLQGNSPQLPQNDLPMLYKLYRTSSNPKQMIERLIQSNPMLASYVNSGANLQQTFYAMCQERGINPEDILKQFK